MDLAQELDALNSGRREVERELTEAAILAVEREANFDPDAPAIVVAGDGWHPGVIGIVAGRLRERYRKPVVVIGIDRAADVGKGSGRSSPGVNLGQAIQIAFEQGLLLSGGGHAMAAGLAIRPSSIPEFRAFLCESLAAEAAMTNDDLDIDALVSPEASTRLLLSDLQRMAPFGPGNPEPMLALPDVRGERAKVLRGGHIRCTLSGERGARLEAIAWRAQDSELGRRLLGGDGGLHVAGRLKANDWNGRVGVQLEIEDVADPRRVTVA
jgi:single-stranded-DNA-specific exonuclease